MADLEHQQWAFWVQSVIDRVESGEGITQSKVNSWKKNLNKAYHKLPEGEKDKDREWADKVLRILNVKDENTK